MRHHLAALRGIAFGVVVSSGAYVSGGEKPAASSPIAVALCRDGDRENLVLLDATLRPVATRRADELAGWAWRPSDPPVLAIQERVEDVGVRLSLLSGIDLQPVARSQVLEEFGCGGPLGRSGALAFVGEEGDRLAVPLSPSSWGAAASRDVRCAVFDVADLALDRVPGRARGDGLGVGMDDVLIGMEPVSIHATDRGSEVVLFCDAHAAVLDLATGHRRDFLYALSEGPGLFGFAPPIWADVIVDDARLVYLGITTRGLRATTFGALHLDDERSERLSSTSPDPRLIASPRAAALSRVDGRVVAFVLGGDWPLAGELQVLDIRSSTDRRYPAPDDTDLRVDAAGRAVTWNRWRRVARLPKQPGVEEPRELGPIPAGLEDLLVVGAF